MLRFCVVMRRWWPGYFYEVWDECAFSILKQTSSILQNAF